jgi:bifunctional DNase/RNase
MYHEMTVFGLALDALSQRPVVILKDAQEKTTVPIWISNMEVVAIAAELISRDIASQSGRGDLLTALMQEMAMTVAMIAVDDLRDGVFTASIRFVRGEEEVKVAVRPSEALITALKYKLPLMVADDVVARAALLEVKDETSVRESDARRFADFLENLDPEEMGKYPM